MHLKFGISRDSTEKSLNCSSCIPTHHPSWFLTRCHEAHVCILRYYSVHLGLWWSLLATKAVQQYSIHQNTMQLQDAVLTCNQKLTWVSLSYCTEPLMKKMKVKNKNTTIRTYALHIFTYCFRCILFSYGLQKCHSGSLGSTVSNSWNVLIVD